MLEYQNFSLSIQESKISFYILLEKATWVAVWGRSMEMVRRVVGIEDKVQST